MRYTATRLRHLCRYLLAMTCNLHDIFMPKQLVLAWHTLGTFQPMCASLPRSPHQLACCLRPSLAWTCWPVCLSHRAFFPGRS